MKQGYCYTCLDVIGGGGMSVGSLRTANIQHRVFGEGVKSPRGEIAILGRGGHTRNIRAAGRLGKNFPAASNFFSEKPFQQGISDSHSLLEFSESNLWCGARRKKVASNLSAKQNEREEWPTRLLQL